MKKQKYAILLKTAFIKTLPVMAGYLVLGMGFGILLQDKGYGYVAGIHGEFRIRAFARRWKRKRGNRLLFRFFTTQKT